MPSPTIAERVAAHPEWYHTLELGPGLETPGWFDLRTVPDRAGMPASLAGMRCLDVATFDGFWAFEMEKRGAREVLGIDVLDPRQWDWPINSTDEALAATGTRKAMGEGFLIAREALGSNVERMELSVYDLDPEIVGTFDFVYFGSLLLHLRDPVRALERARSVCTGQMLLVDAVDPISMWSPRPTAVFDGKGRPWWWKPNVAALKRMVESGGFEVIGKPKRLLMPPGAGQEKVKPSVPVLRHPEARVALLRSRVGDPHAAILSRPI